MMGQMELLSDRLVTCWQRVVIGLILLLAAWVLPAGAQTGENVLVIVNGASRASDEIGDYYARKRAIPGDQVLRLTLPSTEQISRAVYESQIERPITTWLTTHAAQDRILYLVLTKDVPLRISGSNGPDGTIASVDSELTLVYRKIAGNSVAVAGSVENPYFAGDRPVAEAKPFSHQSQDMYLVARLDGYTVEDVKALIDRGNAPSTAGRVLLDGRFELTQSPGNRWLVKANDTLTKLAGWSDRVVLDITHKPLRDESEVLGYYSWGSNDRTLGTRHPNIRFTPGALGGEFVSTDARTFQEPPATWQVNRTDMLYRGSHQSLIGDLIRDGITGVGGSVAEPYISATVRPDILFPAYVSGFNLVESYYLAIPKLSWQMIVVGDPLCAPFKTQLLTARELDPPIDQSTELPGFLSERQLAAVTTQTTRAEAARLFVKSGVLTARGDDAAARQALEQATTIDPSFITAHLSLAGLYGSAGRWDDAIDRFRRVIAKSPNHPVALNELAYTLAVRKHSLNEALSLAKRAYTVPHAGPEATDTLAWIYHLLGRDTDAEPLIMTAARQLPGRPEVLLHAAIILSANGNGGGAVRNLEAAVRLDATLNDRADVQELRKRLPASK
jgi:uncharacterized protein (TIGR03790 family)